MGKRLAVPEELERALQVDAEAGAIFEALAPSHRAEYVQWIAEAKQAKTRMARAAKATEMMKAKSRGR